MNECVNDSIDGMYLHYYLYGGVQMRCLLSGAVTVPPDQPHGRANLYTKAMAVLSTNEKGLSPESYQSRTA